MILWPRPGPGLRAEGEPLGRRRGSERCRRSASGRVPGSNKRRSARGPSPRDDRGRGPARAPETRGLEVVGVGSGSFALVGEERHQGSLPGRNPPELHPIVARRSDPSSPWATATSTAGPSCRGRLYSSPVEVRTTTASPSMRPNARRLHPGARWGGSCRWHQAGRHAFNGRATKCPTMCGPPPPGAVPSRVHAQRAAIHEPEEDRDTSFAMNSKWTTLRTRRVSCMLCRACVGPSIEEGHCRYSSSW